MCIEAIIEGRAGSFCIMTSSHDAILGEVLLFFLEFPHRYRE